MSKPNPLRELWQFLYRRKKWWIGPVIIFLLVLGGLLLLAKGSVLSPFIYSHS